MVLVLQQKKTDKGDPLPQDYQLVAVYSILHEAKDNANGLEQVIEDYLLDDLMRIGVTVHYNIVFEMVYNWNMNNDTSTYIYT